MTTPPAPGGPRPRRRWRTVVELIASVVLGLALVATGALVALTGLGLGPVDPAARGTGHDALWLGHAWVDGRRGPADVTALAAQLRDTGVRDLFVHSGPFRDDGTLDAGLRPRATWLTTALHAALPGVRVQAWLGAHPGELDLADPTTRTRLLTAVGQVLDDGFDGVHYDFEPVVDGDPDLLTLLHDTRDAVHRRHAIVSVSAIHTEPWPGLARALARPVGLSLWSAGYLGAVAAEVDQVALMAYDTGLLTTTQYQGYLRRVTRAALAAVPPGVALLIGVPAYHEASRYHRPGAETVPAALRGIRLGLGGPVTGRAVGVALYVDFTATAADWTAYHDDWA